MRKRHIGSLLAAVFCCLLLSAALPGALAETADVDFHWELTVLSWETAESLEATQAITSYEGDVNIAVHEDAPAEGCLYLLVKFSLAKTAAGGEGFRWEQLFAVDEEGVYYARMENDTFIETYGFKRLPATEIRIGSKQGFIAFEVPVEAAQDEFSFVYALTEDTELPIALVAQEPMESE